MADYTTTIDVRAEDNATNTLKDLQGVLNTFSRGIGYVNGAVRRYNTMMREFNSTMVDVLGNVGGAIIDFTSDAIDNFTKLEEQHAKTLGAMANDYDNTLESQQKFLEASRQLKDQAIELGTYGPTGQGSFYSATEVSEVQTELVKSGKKPEEILNSDAVGEILKFAAGNNLETGDAIDFAVTLGSQFGYKMDDWGPMLDQVSHAADLSVVDVSDIVQSMKYAGGISSGLDKDMSETLSTIAYLGNFGLKGSMAGTGVQALLTRFLTSDTTVITDAQKEVAPPKALDAFYKFEKSAKPNGELLNMSDIVPLLDETMSGLNDEEQAWFAKKLAGLYQMKAMYALTNDNGGMTLEEMEQEVAESSEGTNDNKYGILLNSSYGLQESLTNAWEGVKTDFGDRISVLTDKVRKELYNVLSSDGSYRIDFDGIRDALYDAVDNIEEKFGSGVADAVKNLGNFTIDFSQIIEEVSPEFASGMLDVLNNIIDFDVKGTMDGWKEMISNMKDSVSDLPEDMQGLGSAVVGVIDWMGKLVAINIAAEGLQMTTDMLLIITNISKAANLLVTYLAGVPGLIVAVAGIAAILGVSALGDSVTDKWQNESIAKTIFSKDNSGAQDKASSLVTSDIQETWNTFAKNRNISNDGSLATLLTSEMQRYLYNQNEAGRTVTSDEYNSVLKDLYNNYTNTINGTTGYYTGNGNTLTERGTIEGSDYTEYIYGKDKNGTLNKADATTLMTELSEYINNYEYSGAQEVKVSGTNVTVDGGNALGTGTAMAGISLALDGQKIPKSDKNIYTSKDYSSNKVTYKENDEHPIQQIIGGFSQSASKDGGYAFQPKSTGFGGAVESLLSGINNLDVTLAEWAKQQFAGGKQPDKNSIYKGSSTGVLKPTDDSIVVDNQLTVEDKLEIMPQALSLSPMFNINVKVDKDGNITQKTVGPQTWKQYINTYNQYSARYSDK